MLKFGEYFEGDLVGFSAPKVLNFDRYTHLSHHDLRALVPARKPVGELGLPLSDSGADWDSLWGNLTFSTAPIVTSR